MRLGLSSATLLLGLALSGVVLSGCGDQAEEAAARDPATASAGEPTSREPACEDLWVDGGTIPERYGGCSEGETWVEAATQRCESGQVLVTYDDRYYGAKGSRVNDMGESLSDSDQYQRALKSCG